MPLNSLEETHLARLEAAFEELGGHRVDLAERIDQLRRKRDEYDITVRITVPNTSREFVVTDALNETLRALAYEGVIDDSNDDAWQYENLRA